MCAHGAVMSEDEEVTMAWMFVAEVVNGVGGEMDLVTKLDMNHYDHS